MGTDEGVDGHVCVVCLVLMDPEMSLLCLLEDEDDVGRGIGMEDGHRGVVSPLLLWHPLGLGSLLQVDLVHEVSWLSNRSI